MSRVRWPYVAVLMILLVVAVGWAWPAGAQSPSETCAACHVHEYEGWAQSAHAGASPAFSALTKSPAAVSTWGSDGCYRCHAPVGGTGAASGVSCEACHLLERVGGVGGGDFHLATDGILRSATVGKAPHPTTALSLFSDSLFCAACHEQYHPATGVVLQSTYTEWLNSAASREGKTCQTCHMAADLPSHAFDAGGADAAATGKALARAIAMDVAWPSSAQAGAPLAVDVRVENVAAGHALPTGKVEGSEMWLEMAATVGGRTVFTETLPYGVLYADDEGNYKPRVTSLDAASVFVDHRLFPGRTVAERFVFSVPSDVVRGRVDVEVRLMYRRTPLWLSERLGLPVAAPIVVHRAAVALSVLEPPPRPTYVLPTPTPTAIASPTPLGGPEEGTVKTEERGWLGPFFLVSVLLLLGVSAWALKRRAV